MSSLRRANIKKNLSLKNNLITELSIFCPSKNLFSSIVDIKKLAKLSTSKK